DTLERHFAQLAGRRWGGFATPLRAALEAEAQEDEARTERLTVPFKEATLMHGGEEDVWRLKGVSIEALRALDDGEWLEILDDQARSRANARVIDTHPGAGTLVIGVRASSDPPRTGFVRPRSRKKILEQKRALLEELASPTGSLPNLVRLVAAPASMPTPHAVRPERFVNPAILRNRSQARAVGLALGLEDGQALLIQGPPGTGKSTTAAEIDVQLILRDPGVRVLVCSHSNHGTDNMLMKVLPYLPDAQERIARIGFFERIAKEARPFYAAADQDLGDRNIIFTTIDALVLQDVAGARVYDYVILDEANRAGVLDSLLALARGRRMVLVGDPMQLQPVMSETEQQMVSASSTNGRHGRRGGKPAMVGVALPGAQHVIGKSLFAWIQERRFAPAATVLLDQQNRMHPAIGELVSRVFYAERVRTGPAAPRRGTGLPAFPSPVTWVDTRALKGNVESRAGGTSLFNVAEARLVTSITRHLAAHAPPNLTIGVITAYAEQRDLLRRLMGPHDWPPDRALEIDTVDAFEGREKDIIVLSLVRANRRRDIGFLRLEQRLNVAVSRSRRLIIIVGDTSTLRAGFFGHLVATAQAVGQIVPAPKLIGQFLQPRAGAGPVGRRPRRERDERRRDGAPRGPAESQLDLDELAAADEFAAAERTGAGLTRDEYSREGLAGREGAPLVEREGAPFAEPPTSGEGVRFADRATDSAAGRSGAPGGGREGMPLPGRDGAAGPGGPGQEGGGSAGSRRRRRRAWERRRERMRALHEQQLGQTPEEAETASGDEPRRGDDASTRAEAMPGQGAPRRPRDELTSRSGEATPGYGEPKLKSVEATRAYREPLPSPGEGASATEEATSGARLRGRRRRRFGIPIDDQAGPFEPPAAAETSAEPEVAPAGSANRLHAADQPLREDTGQPPETGPVTRRRRRTRGRRDLESSVDIEAARTQESRLPHAQDIRPQATAEGTDAPMKRRRRTADTPPPVVNAPLASAAPADARIKAGPRAAPAPLSVFESVPPAPGTTAPAPVKPRGRKAKGQTTGLATPAPPGAPTPSAPAAIEPLQVTPKADPVAPTRKSTTRGRAPIEQPSTNGSEVPSRKSGEIAMGTADAAAQAPATRSTRARRTPAESTNGAPASPPLPGASDQPPAAIASLSPGAAPAAGRTRARRLASESPNGTAATSSETVPAAASPPDVAAPPQRRTRTPRSPAQPA
ncbi:MAG: AAA family ATPase, partial [Chloroflexi bacterium]|nr:AAA family ATPase [Chloroflexota bacterium]